MLPRPPMMIMEIIVIEASNENSVGWATPLKTASMARALG
jgi:hypothetical protein